MQHYIAHFLDITNKYKSEVNNRFLSLNFSNLAFQKNLTNIQKQFKRALCEHTNVKYHVQFSSHMISSMKHKKKESKKYIILCSSTQMYNIQLHMYYLLYVYLHTTNNFPDNKLHSCSIWTWTCLRVVYCVHDRQYFLMLLLYLVIYGFFLFLCARKDQWKNKQMLWTERFNEVKN